MKIHGPAENDDNNNDDDDDAARGSSQHWSRQTQVLASALTVTWKLRLVGKNMQKFCLFPPV